MLTNHIAELVSWNICFYIFAANNYVNVDIVLIGYIMTLFVRYLNIYAVRLFSDRLNGNNKMNAFESHWNSPEIALFANRKTFFFFIGFLSHEIIFYILLSYKQTRRQTSAVKKKINTCRSYPYTRTLFTGNILVTRKRQKTRSLLGVYRVYDGRNCPLPPPRKPSEIHVAIFSISHRRPRKPNRRPTDQMNRTDIIIYVTYAYTRACKTS